MADPDGVKKVSTTNLLMYGTSWCPDCKRSIMVLDEFGIEYDFVNIEEDEDAAEKVEEINGGFRSVPTIVFPDGSTLTEPSREELLNKLDIIT